MSSSLLPPPGWVNGGTAVGLLAAQLTNATLAYGTGSTGNRSLSITQATASVSCGVSYASVIEVAPGEIYNLACNLNTSAGTFTAALRIFDKTGAFLSDIASGSTTSATYVALSNSGTVPANGAFALPIFYHATTNAVNTVANLDDVKLKKSYDLGSSTDLANKTLDNIADTATYGRVNQTALTTNSPDMAKSGIVNRTLDNIADTATYARPTTAAVQTTNLTSAATPVKFYSYVDYKTSGSGTLAIPNGARLLTIRGWGGGGSGYEAGLIGTNRGGGGGGAFKKTVQIQPSDWGGLLTYAIGAGGLHQPPDTNGNPGGNSTVTSSGLSFTNLNLVANGGGAATQNGSISINGTGGTASGGDTNNSGTNGAGTIGGNSGTIDNITGAGGIGAIGKTPGGGGGGASPAGDGARGELHFIWS